MRAARFTGVGYKLIAIKVGLLSRDHRIYTDSLQQKQAILCIFDYSIDDRQPVFAGKSMIDTFF